VKIALCDDNPIELKKISNSIDAFLLSENLSDSSEIKTFLSADEVLRYTEQNGQFDLLFLDIVMPGMNGIELAKELRSKDRKSMIVFLTTSSEYAVSSYQVDAFYYLLKPYSPSDINSLLKKVFNKLESEKSTSIVVKESGKLTKIEIHNIQFLESIKHMIHFHLRDSSIISCYGTINEFSDLLLSDERFVRCHKSFIINMNFVKSLSGSYFIMQDKVIIPISRQSFKQIKNTYIDFFFKKDKVVL